MTIAADQDLAWSVGDRRRSSAQPRRSWASTQPVEVRTTEHNRADVKAQQWAVVGPRLQRRVFVVEAFVTAAVAFGFLAVVYGPGVHTTAVAVLCTAGFLALVALSRGYDLRRLGDGPEEFQSVLRAGAIGAAVLMGISYTTQAEISRLLVFGGVPALVVLTAGARYVHRRLLHAVRRRDAAMMKRTLVIGAERDVVRVSRELRSASYHGYLVDSVCLPSLDGTTEVDGHRVVGAVADVAQVVADRAIDVVVVAGPSLSEDALRRLSWALDRVGAQLVVVPDLVEVTGPRIALRPAAGLSLLEVEVAAPRRRYVAKTLMDRVLGAGILLAAAPVILGAALAVKLTSPGSAFYRQTRVGVDGVPFTMWKLRSMYVDADRRRDLLAEQSDGNGVLFKMHHDPRVTPVGRFLRHYSLDELPQLFNVVRGDM
ncbi:MAG TPA: sugar transferase, partial [Actinotalea sp.]|nr:sugar transferase [Actinotalea sp.]